MCMSFSSTCWIAQFVHVELLALLLELLQTFSGIGNDVDPVIRSFCRGKADGVIQHQLVEGLIEGQEGAQVGLDGHHVGQGPVVSRQTIQIDIGVDVM